jgi:hypothetical protein
MMRIIRRCIHSSSVRKLFSQRSEACNLGGRRTNKGTAARRGILKFDPDLILEFCSFTMQAKTNARYYYRRFTNPWENVPVRIAYRTN